jgi:hypothetical protein
MRQQRAAPPKKKPMNQQNNITKIRKVHAINLSKDEAHVFIYEIII